VTSQLRRVGLDVARRRLQTDHFVFLTPAMSTENSANVSKL
jgi:hypothetical protein